MTKNVRLWLRSLIAAIITGGAGGVVTGFAAIGIDPTHFNLAAGLGHTLEIAGVAAALHAILGLAMFLQQSPLPKEDEA